MTTEKKVIRIDPRKYDDINDMSENETAFFEFEAKQEAERIIQRLSMKSKSFRRLVAMHLDSLTKKGIGNE